ncbi:MAG: TolC family protein [Gemmatimonadaceae bacterium]
MFLSLLVPLLLQGQSPVAPTPLDDLVAIALRDNLGQRQQALAIARADAAMREARGLYLPSATFNARYTELAGNTVNIGQMINPAFGALNQLLQKPAFPTNVDVELPMRQETTMRIAQPLFQPSIVAANRVAGAMADLQTAQRDAHAQALAADVRSGYLGYARLHYVVGIYDSTLALLDEHVRVSERLVANGLATPDVVLRARAERSDVQQRRDEAAQLRDAARQGVNTLLNRPNGTPLPVFSDSVLAPGDAPPLDVTQRHARTRREELRQLDHALRASEARHRLARGSFLPSLSLAVDYGIQGKTYRFDASRDFAALTLVASWNVFNGGQDLARVQQADLETRQLAAQRDELARAVELQVATAWDAARVARRAIGTADDRLASARRSFELMRRKREEGAASQLEFLDARVTFTTAQLNQVITRYDYLLRRVALDRAASLYEIATPSTDTSSARSSTPR